MSFLRHSFKFSSEVGYAGTQTADVQAAPQQSLLSLISSASTKVNMDLSQQFDPSKPGAQCAAENAMKGVVAAQQELNGQIALAFEDIGAAQAEIKAAVQATGREVGDVFPAASSGDEMGGVAIDIASNLNGGGTFATFMKAISGTTKAADIANMAKGSTPDAVKVEINDALRASSNPVQMQTAGFGHIQDGNAPVTLQAESQFDWNQIIDQYPDAIDAIMRIDVTNPNPDIFPDLANMVASSKAADTHIEKLQNTIDQANKMGTPSCAGEALAMTGVMTPELAEAYETDGFALAAISASDADAIKAAGPSGKVADVPEEPSINREAELAEIARRFEQPTIPRTGMMA